MIHQDASDNDSAVHSDEAEYSVSESSGDESGMYSGPEYEAIQEPTYDLTDFATLRQQFYDETVNPMKKLRHHIHLNSEELDMVGDQWMEMDRVVWCISITETTFTNPIFDLDLEAVQTQISALNQQYMHFRLSILQPRQQLIILQSTQP